MKVEAFLSRHPVFNTEEWKIYLTQWRSEDSEAQKGLLRYYRDQGRILMVRRGLWASVPVGSDPERFQIDPYLVAAKLKPDSVLCYHTALEFHGKAYSVFKRFTYTSQKQSTPLQFQSQEYTCVLEQEKLSLGSDRERGIKTVNRSGIEVRVTNLERTLVDILHRPQYAGDWEEIWRSLSSVEYYDTDQVIKYTRMLKNATTAAKVGFFLDQHQNELMIDDSYIEPLKRMIPKQPHYMERSKRRDSKLVADWNLMVPVDILEKTWEEPS